MSDFLKAYDYALAEAMVECQLEIAALKAENSYLMSQRVGSSIPHPDEEYNNRVIAKYSAKLEVITGLRKQ